MLPSIYYTIYDFLNSLGIDVSMLRFCTTVVLWLLTIAGSLLAYLVFLRVCGPIIRKVASRTRTKWDDYILSPKIIKAFSWIVAAVVLRYYLPSSTLYYPGNIYFVVKICNLIALGSIIWFLNQLINSVYDTCVRLNREIHGLTVYRNALQVVITSFGVLMLLSVLLDRDIALIVSGLGAMAAVLMLVFRDSILGLVAGFKLTVNKMLSKGDWIIVEHHGANGIVEDVRLSTVKVRNWDNSIVTVPPYSLVSEGFQNLQEMKRTGGRRIMRSITIDMNTVRKLRPEEMTGLRGEPWAEGVDFDRPQVNVTLFRRFLRYYISVFPTSRGDMLQMIRELQPTSEGLPIEIYLFTDCTEWADYEEVQADLIDGILAEICRFDLRIYQKPAFFSLQNQSIQV